MEKEKEFNSPQCTHHEESCCQRDRSGGVLFPVVNLLDPATYHDQVKADHDICTYETKPNVQPCPIEWEGEKYIVYNSWIGAADLSHEMNNYQVWQPTKALFPITEDLNYLARMQITLTMNLSLITDNVLGAIWQWRSDFLSGSIMWGDKLSYQGYKQLCYLVHVEYVLS